MRCAICGTETSNPVIRRVPVKACAVTHAVIVGETTVYLCRKCDEKYDVKYYYATTGEVVYVPRILEDISLR